MNQRVLDNRYELQELIGGGGMADVYKARDILLDRTVAVKILHEQFKRDTEFIQKFHREAQAAAKLSHPNIVNIYDVGVMGDDHYIVMEYVPGSTLKDRIKQEGHLSVADALHVARDIASALAHAHANNLVHCDIKPHNILMMADGSAKVADFGIARAVTESTMTYTGNVVGSVHYFSPEQAKGTLITPKSDVYSLGVVLYEMLTGRVPFDGENQVAIAMQHIHNRPTPIEKIVPDVPASLNAVCMKALAKNPVYRYQSAKEMASDLRLVMDGKIMPPPRMDTIGTTAVLDDTGENPSFDTEENEVQPRKKEKKKINWPWWIFTVLTVLLVFLGLYWGGRSIYDGVINSTEVPACVGLELTAAQKAVQKASLSSSETYINHPTIPQGTVVMQAPGEGTVLRKDDTVVLTISAGPASVEVPKLVGMTTSDAISLAQKHGLNATVVERVPSAEVQSDFVMAQTPKNGESIKAGDTIQLKVSGGLAFVPEMTGKTFTEARRQLAQAGLTLSDNITFVPTEDELKHNLVEGQSETAGTPVTQGTEIILRVYQVTTMTFAATVKVTLSPSSTPQKVRLTLSDRETEYTVFSKEMTAVEGQEPESVRIISQEPGEFEVKVYIDGEFKYSEGVLME